MVKLSVCYSVAAINESYSKKDHKEDTNVLSELKDGFSYAFGFIPIRYIIFLLGLISLMGMQYTVLMPVFAKRDFTRRFSYFRILMGASDWVRFQVLFISHPEKYNGFG